MDVARPIAAALQAASRWAAALAISQLTLDLLVVALAGVARVEGRTLRSSRRDQSRALAASAVLLIKRLHGHCAERPFEYVKMGHGWLAHALPLGCWLHALRVLSPSAAAAHPRRVLAALALTTAVASSRLYPLCLVYTGGGGFWTVHGAGFNVYFTGADSRGRRWDGERFFAADWHAEKLPERVNGRFLPRADQRVVCWPHAHLCWLGLEFWPWSDEVSRDEREAVADQRRRARAERDGRRAAAAAPQALAAEDLNDAVSAVLSDPACVDELDRRFGKGESVRRAAEWLTARVAAHLEHLPSAKTPQGRQDVENATMRATGKQFAAWKASARATHTSRLPGGSANAMPPPS